MEHLSQHWDEIVRRVRAANAILLFLDYDGTLTPIVARPETAVLSPRARQILKRISHHNLFKLAIVSGRSLQQIKALVGLDNVTYAGNHGLEIEYFSGTDVSSERDSKTTVFVHPVAQEFQPEVTKLERRLRDKLAGFDGVLLENKGLTLSLHYRLARQEAVHKIRRLFFEALEYGDASPRFRVTEGKKVLEVRPPVEWNKGKAVEWLLEIYATPQSLAIFAGDDITDEDAFQALHKVGGISVFVGEHTTSSTANYRLNSPEELHFWLEKLVDTLPSRIHGRDACGE